MSNDRPTLRDLMDLQRENNEQIQSIVERFDYRIRSLENNQTKVSTYITIFVTFFSAAAAYFWNKVLGNN